MVVFSLTVVRHGETLYNRKSIIQGQTDVPLSDIGIKQAKLVAEVLQHENFTHVFTSDLSRARETAEVIMQTSKACRSKVRLDKRLRERKFGEFEGKFSKDLMTAAKNANKFVEHWTEFTPKGAETYEEVHNRAISFFRDLCKQLLTFTEEENNYIPGSIKRRCGGSLRTHRKVKGQMFQRSQSFCGFPDISQNEIQNGAVYTREKRRKQDQKYPEKFVKRRLSTGDCDIMFNDEYSTLQDKDGSRDDDSVGIQNVKKTEIGNIILPGTGLSQEFLDLARSEPIMTRSKSNSTSSGYGSQPEDGQSKDEDFIVFLDKPTCQKDQNISAVNKKVNGKDLQYPCSDILRGCPNVTLSPQISHRLPSMSSISSGRNSSFDDIEGPPVTVADVLLVSHGGLIKELVRYFMDDLNCKIPGDKGNGIRICHNCSISKFFISLPSVDEDPGVSCLFFNEKEHLQTLNITAALGKF